MSSPPLDDLPAFDPQASPEAIALRSGNVDPFAVLTSLQPDLEHARSEYMLERYDAVQQNTTGIFDKAKSYIKRLAPPPGIRACYELLMASARCLLARSYRATGNADKAAEAFGESISLFHAHEQEIDSQRNASRLWTDYGIALYRAGRVSGADRALRKAEETGAGAQETFGYLGLIYRQQGKLKDSETALRKALQLAPGDPVLNRALGETLAAQGDRENSAASYRDAAFSAWRTGKLSWAEELAAHALRQVPGDASTVTFYVEVLASQNKFEQAVEALDEVIATRQPTPLWACGLKGRMLRRQGKIDAAIDVLKAIPVTRPDMSWVLTELAYALYDKNRIGECEAALTKVFELTPDDVAALLLHGRVLIGQDHPEQACERLKRALTVNPQFLTAQYELARAQFLCRRQEEALRNIDAFLAAKPDSTEAIQLKAYILSDLRRVDEATTQMRRALRARPGDEHMLKFIVETLERAGRAEDAVRELDAEIRRDPDSSVPLALKGDVLLRMGETAAAAEVLQKAVALAPGDADIQTTYANALRLLGKYDEANEVYERVLASGTTSEFAQGWIGIFFSEIGEFKRATEVLQPTVDRYPKEAWLWSALGWAWQSLDFSSASLSADAYKKAMELEPERIWNWKGYADALFLLDPDKGRAEYEELLKALNASTNLEEEWRLYLLGWSNYRLRRYDDAVYLLQRAMHFDPNEYGPYFDVPLTLLAAGRRESAIREYTGALEKIKPLHARRQHGLLYIARFDLVEAVWHQCVAPDNAGPIIEKIDTALRESEFDTAKFAWMDEYVSPAWARPQLATPRPFAARDPAISRTAS